MDRLIQILGKTKYSHRFILSRGPDGITLPDNFKGVEFINQIALLQQVDAIITHGGNNTIIECFYYAVPCIVIPLFSDQHDNAQRIRETGLGKVLEYDFGSELDDMIHELVNDQNFSHKLAKIANNMRAKSNAQDFVEKLEKLVHEFREKI